MDDIQTEMTSILSNVLYYCDWTLLSDNGLSGGQLSAYTTLRASIHSVIANILTYNDTQLLAVIPTANNAASDASNRCQDFTTNMTALQTALNGL